ncbi:MAG: hypothetical protein IKU52_01750 [Clostridia bacterium]|nr:hypothetical protein [Clostridia bacterium]
MSKILTKEEFKEHLHKYYTEHFGKRESDIFYESDAVNVITFLRNGKFITLKCHILSGEIEKFIEESSKE